MKKDQTKRESDASFREKKRAQDKLHKEELDKVRDKFEEDTLSQRADIKKRIQIKFERKEKVADSDIQDLKSEFKEMAAEIAADKRSVLESEKRVIEKQVE